MGTPQTEEDDRTEIVGQDPTPEASAHRTPDESTVGLVSTTPPTDPPSTAGGVPDLEVGETLAGRFTVLRFIARGGMGAVYEASDVLLRTRVALKVIASHLATDRTAMERFRREVLLARRVTHPNVCRVYELYEARTARGVPIHFLTMELLEGESLAHRLARTGRMTTEEALPLVRQMCDALEAAHGEGVIHRDFKSSNVLLVPRPVAEERATQSTRVVITDFGVARALHLAREEEADEGPLTGRGILGTPEYMAPEQVTGAEVTAAADIYALGVVLYEMVTGKLPFAADTPLAAAARRLNEAPPRPETTMPGLDRRWSAAIVRCLARQPERRFKSARDIISALDAPAGRARYAAPLAVAAVLLLLAGTYGFVRYRPSLRLREPEKTSVQATPRTKVAILGVRDELGSPKLKWLPTAVGELLAHEIAGAESSLRVIEPDVVDVERESLGLSEKDVGDGLAQKRLQALLDADVFAYGDLSAEEPGSDSVRLRFQVLEAPSGRAMGSFDESLGPNAARLVEEIPELAARLMSLLRASVTTEQASALSASRAHSLDAARLYAKGVMRLRAFEFEDARSHFEEVVTADSGFVQPQRRIAQTWELQGNQKKALAWWKRIRARPGGVTAMQAAVIDARILSEEGKVGDAWKALFEAIPDDLSIPWVPRWSPSLIKRQQRMRAGPPLALEMYEALAVRKSDPQRANELVEHVAEQAARLGAKLELAWVRQTQGEFLLPAPSHLEEALARFQEAERLFGELGQLDNIADAKAKKAFWLGDANSRNLFLPAMDEAAGAYRRLGKRRQVANLFLVTAEYLREIGELSAARKRLEATRLELEGIDDRPDSYLFASHFVTRAWLEFDAADLEAAREALRRGRGGSVPAGIELAEATFLHEEDQREHARGAYLKAKALAQQAGYSGFPVAIACTVDCDGDQPAAGLACLAEACRADQPGAEGAVRNAGCLLEEARCSFRANDLARAEQAARRALAPPESQDRYELSLRARAILMRVAAAHGESAKAIRVLRADLAKVESEKNRRLAFETSLALGDVELKAGRPEGRARLLKLEQEAKSREFLRIARLAREALDRRPGHDLGSGEHLRPRPTGNRRSAPRRPKPHPPTQASLRKPGLFFLGSILEKLRAEGVVRESAGGWALV